MSRPAEDARSEVPRNFVVFVSPGGYAGEKGSQTFSITADNIKMTGSGGVLFTRRTDSGRVEITAMIPREHFQGAYAQDAATQVVLTEDDPAKAGPEKDPEDAIVLPSDAAVDAFLKADDQSDLSAEEA